MCDCITRIEEKLTEKCKEKRFNKPFEKVDLETSLVIIGNKLEARTFCRAFITLTGQKKVVETNVLHSYCPFCGEKIVKDEDDK